MKLPLRIILPAAIASLLGASAIFLWLSPKSEMPTQPRLPETEAPAVAQKVALSQNEGTTASGPGQPSALKGSWLQFRGADRTNIVREEMNFPKTWPADFSPRVLWQINVGEGHAGTAINNGRVYLLDYDRSREEDVFRCLSLDDGREIWRHSYSVKVKRNHGMSRTVPAVNDKYVVGIGPMCHVRCLDALTGQLVWKLDLARDFGTIVPPWYAGQCPLIDGENVIIAPGGDPLMMSVDLATGKILWRAKNPGGWGMTHSSITPLDVNGERQYIYCTTEGVAGVSALDGKILWTHPAWKIAMATVPSPLVLDADKLFLTGGYNTGSALLKLGGNPHPEELLRLKYTLFGADQQTPIFYDGNIYGVTNPGELACLDLKGNRLWSSGADNRFGLGPFILAGGLLFCLNDQSGTLHVVRATPQGYQELSKAKVLEGHDAWGPMAIAAGRLILRDLTTLICLELPREK